MNVRRILTAAVVAIAAAEAASAATVLTPFFNLDDLIDNNGVIVVGDKQFSNFAYSASGDMPTADLVNVAGIISNVGNFGLRFQGGFTDTPLSAGGSDALITYRVTVVGSSQKISDAHLDSDLDVIPDGIAVGFGSITEGFVPFIPLAPLIPEQITNFDFENIPPGTTQLHDEFEWGAPGYTSIDISKDIFMLVEVGAAVLSKVDQTYSQTPLPGSALSGLVLLGALAASRKAARGR